LARLDGGTSVDRSESRKDAEIPGPSGGVGNTSGIGSIRFSTNVLDIGPGIFGITSNGVVLWLTDVLSLAIFGLFNDEPGSEVVKSGLGTLGVEVGWP
jgi:hypothetical protein